jgi:flagellar motor component MotA
LLTVALLGAVTHQAVSVCLPTAGIIGLVVGVIACFIPEQTTKQLWSGWSWAVPVAAMLALGYLLRGFFMR